VRHPGYAGNILPLLGIVLALGSVWTLIPAAAALIIAVIRTVLEDQTSAGRVAGLSRLCTARELSVDSGDLLRSLTSAIRFGGGVLAQPLLETRRAVSLPTCTPNNRT
jgi:hypothetical protein